VARLTTHGKPERKQYARNTVRRSVYKCVESLKYDPNPSDLGGGRLKRLERGVEDRKRF
jgi:hypothetical protein